MSAIKEQLKPLLSFINETEIKDLVFLLSKSPSRAIFDEIRTVDNLLTALEKWYGLEAMPIVLCNALMVADQRVLAVCIRNVCQGARASASIKQTTVPSQLRQLMFKVISEFPDSKAVDLQRRMGLPNDPVPRDSLDLMATLLDNRIVTDSNIKSLQLLAPLSPVIGGLCNDYNPKNGLVQRTFNVSSGDLVEVGGARWRPNCAAPTRLAESHEMKNPMCLILNVNNVPGQEVRKGSEIDVATIRDLFEKKFRYLVLSLSDPDEPGYRHFLSDVKKRLLKSTYDGLVFFVMSHGDESYIELAQRNARLHCFKDIVAPFLDGCLREKPKVFFFQCCRGLRLQQVLSFDGPGDHTISDQDNSELYVFHATFEGFAAVREPDRGSWFMQTLCQLLDVPQRIEIETLRMSITRELNARRSEVPASNTLTPTLINQTPTVEKNSLTKLLYLKPL